MWPSVLQVSLSLWTSHCFDFLSEWQRWLLHFNDNFELLLRTHFTQINISNINALLLYWKNYFFDRPNSAFGNNSLEYVRPRLSASPQNMLRSTSLFRSGLVLKELSDLQDVCLVYNFTQAKIIRLSFRPFFRQMPFLFAASVTARVYPLPSILRCFPNLMTCYDVSLRDRTN